ncbi:TonB-dependent receptor [Niabella beijingensis]|uniref:TonB-dependent receptor n=1 Tax=Niabella beijingensis TaxID=2872700 RepID=UPI001CBF9914|nr:TonB-dependent receptor [Niabella beijingensis]MBZ4190169.1 TonB-dependent receptor [Niabella beijingensis]
MKKFDYPAVFLRGRLIVKYLLLMKLAISIIFITSLQALALKSESQERINLNLKNKTISYVLKVIESGYDYKFFYGDSVALNRHHVDLSVTNATIDNVMQQLLRNTAFSYKKMNERLVVIVGEKGARAALSVTGKVTDSNGKPLGGVSIIEKGTNNGTATKEDGTFSLSVKDESAVLTVSNVGYETQEVQVSASGRIAVTMQATDTKMNEVIVVGYGTQRKKDITGAVSSVSSEEMNKTPSTSIAEMLRGKAPGVQVTMGSAAPGGSSTILIRGRRSLSAGNTPLFVVDGVPMTSIDDINANDIESVQILKDASAQSIYGARAANGVILVTTKRGINGKLRVNYNGYLASQRLDRNFEFYNGKEWAAYRKEAFYNANGYYDESEAFSELMLDALYSGNEVNWEDVMIDPALQHKHDVLIQSGNDKTKYALGLGYFYQDGMVPSSDFKRMTGRLNIDQKIAKNFTIGSNILFTKSWRTIADGSFNSFITMPPLAKIYNDDGSLREDVTEAGESHYNPLWDIRNSKNTNNAERLLINLFADWKIAKWISYRANLSMNNRTDDDNIYKGTRHSTGKNTQGSAYVSTTTAKDYLVENILNLTASLHPKHQLEGTLMQSINQIRSKQMGVSGTGFPNDDLFYNGIGQANQYGLPSWTMSDRTLLSYMGRVRYNFMSRYLLTLAMRIDGSSVFGKNNKYGYFPSAAFAWRAKNERFLIDKDWLSDLKLRLSYGQVGNQGVNPYTTLGLTDKYLSEFGNIPVTGYLPGSSLRNPDLKWETSTSANIGLDFSLLKERLSGTIDWYHTETTDLLVSRSLPRTSGYVSQLVNLGRVQNSGLEIALNAQAVKTKDFSWDLNITFTKNRNKIKQIDGTVDANGKPNDDVNNKWFIGYPMNVYYDYAFDGIWQNGDDIAHSYMPAAKPGSIRVKNTNGDSTITADDRVILLRDPKWLGSLGTSFSYKNFTLSADLYISEGGVLYNAYLATFSTGGDLTGKRNGLRRNYWTQNNPSNEAPAPNMVQAPAYLNSLAYEDASYMRLRNVVLAYNLADKKLLRNLAVQNLRVYLSLTNYWTRTKVQAYGPEQDTGDYPEPKTILFGLNVTF